MKKKKGSSLLGVTIFTTVIITVAAVSLTVVANDYKMKVNESKKVANLYGAESGLNMAYNVLVKVFDYAVEVSNQAVEAMLDNNDLDLDQSQEKMNEVFQEAFISVFESKTLPGDKNGTKIDGILEYSLSNQVYPVFENNQVIFKRFDFDSSEQLNIQVEKRLEESKFTFTFTSDFISSTQNQESNERKVSVNYSLYVPTYQGAIKENFTTVSIENYPVFVDSVVNIDGNANVTGLLEVKGNLRVKGMQVETNDVVYGKYAQGIKVSNGALNVTGKVITNETLSLNQNGGATISEDVYARNVYLGKTGVADGPTKANLVVNNSICLDNDLVLNVQPDATGELSTVNVKNLYGLNDKNLTNSTNGNPIRESSSLIVNSEGASVTITGKTYLSGVAYIDTKGVPYQTGESVAIKGNYLAYSEILPGYENRVQMKYYNPLLLVEAIDNDSSAKKKAEYFVEASSKEGGVSLSNGGVSLNPKSTYTAGAWMNGTTWEVPELALNSTELDEKKASYAKEVFNMGMQATKEDYASGIVKKTVKNQINFEHDVFSEIHRKFNNTYGEVILNNDENVVISIQANEDKINTIRYIDKQTSKVIKTIPNEDDGKSVSKAFIVTNGDVVLEGDVELIGNIIATGNLYIDEENQTKGQIKLEFDPQVTQQIIASNYNDLKDIFKVDSIKYDPTKVEVSDGLGLDDLQTKYYAEDYICVGRWQLLK